LRIANDGECLFGATFGQQRLNQGLRELDVLGMREARLLERQESSGEISERQLRPRAQELSVRMPGVIFADLVCCRESPRGVRDQQSRFGDSQDDIGCIGISLPRRFQEPQCLAQVSRARPHASEHDARLG